MSPGSLGFCAPSPVLCEGAPGLFHLSSGPHGVARGGFHSRGACLRQNPLPKFTLKILFLEVKKKNLSVKRQCSFLQNLCTDSPGTIGHVCRQLVIEKACSLRYLLLSGLGRQHLQKKMFDKRNKRYLSKRNYVPSMLFHAIKHIMGTGRPFEILLNISHTSLLLQIFDSSY